MLILKTLVRSGYGAHACNPWDMEARKSGF